MKRYSLLWRILFVISIVGSYTLSVLPGDVVAPLFSWSDKLNHAAAFLVLAFLLRMGWRVGYWQAFLGLLIYGGLIEISQLFAVHRSAELADVGADTIGTFMGLRLFKVINRVF